MLKNTFLLISVTVLSSAPCYGDSFVVPAGTTVTTPFILANPGDTGFVEYGGEINCTNLSTAVDGNAVLMENINQVVLNQGIISITDAFEGDITCVFVSSTNGRVTNDGLVSVNDEGGGADVGIASQDVANVVIVNNGTVAVLDNGQGGDIGIYSLQNTGILVVNNGIISVQNTTFNGEGNIGIYSELSTNSAFINNGHISIINISTVYDTGIVHINGTNDKISNTGTIFTINQGGGSQSNSIYNESSTNTTILNTGVLKMLDHGAGASHAIHNLASTNTTITNSGVIQLQDDVGAGNDFGIFNDASANTTLMNSGIIYVNGTETDYGVFNTGTNLNLINSGTIYASGYAIYSSGINPNLTLLIGSNLQGDVHFETSAVNLSVQSGLNLALTLDAASVGFGRLNITAPYIVDVDPVIAVVDQTGLAMQADMTADFSDALLNGLYLHRVCKTKCRSYLWSEALGSYRTRSSQSQTLPYTDWLAGCLIGYDLPIRGKSFSLFAGYCYGQAQIQSSPQQANISLACLGTCYEHCLGNTQLELAALGAYVNWKNHRTVMNNLAPGGIDGAHLSTPGGLLAAEAKIARRVPLFCCSPFFNFTLRYAALFLGTYTESGSLANLSVKNRTVGLITTRLDTALLSKRFFGLLEPFVGVYGRYQVQGSEVQSVLLNQSLVFDQGGPLNLAAGVLGLRSVKSARWMRSYFNFEVGFDSAESTRVLSEIGLSF